MVNKVMVQGRGKYPRSARRSLRCSLLISGVMIAVCAITAVAQAFPNKPVRIITSESGGSNDLVSRLIAQRLSATWTQQVIVENRGSARGIVALQTLMKATPDGYTVLYYGSGLWLAPYMQDQAPYDPLRDFAPITLATSSPNMLVIHPGLAAHSVSELISVAKSKPGMLNYSTGSTGTSPHLAAELFNSMAGVKIVSVPYKGGGSAINALAAGEVQIMFPTVNLGTPLVKAGRLRALAVTSAQPSTLAPGLPTVAASGLPGYESVALFGIWAPARTPMPVIDVLNKEIVGALNRPEMSDRLLSAGLNTVGTSPQRSTALIKLDMARMGKVIKDANIRAE